MPLPQHHSAACSRCGVPFAEEAPEGSLCEACAAAVTEDEIATLAADAAPAGEVSFEATVSQQNQVIGDYEILGKLGQGGMGAVYRARQISLDRTVALKILPADLEADETYVARFQREAAVAAGLNHPNLVHVYASGVADGSHFIAMELVEGENLRQRMKRSDISMAESVQICLEVARGLQAAWQRAQLIHRDIKPSNIYLSADGGVKLGDLGLAKSLLSDSTSLTHTGSALGTPHYMSPEQARGEKAIDLRADIYSLGCTLYQLLTGATPYHGTDPAAVINMHINAPPPAIMKVLPQCPIALGRLVNRMLRKSKLERPQTYDELIPALEQIVEFLEQGLTAPGPSAVAQAWKQAGDLESAPARQYGLLWAGLAVLLVVGGVTWWMIDPFRKARSTQATPSKVATASAVPFAATPSVAAAAASPAAGEVKTFGGHRYQLIVSACTWSEAKTKAEGLGGHLATITSAEENAWILSTFGQAIQETGGKRACRVGGIAETQATGWKWVTGEPFEYQAWLQGVPNYKGEPTGAPYSLNLTYRGAGSVAVVWSITPAGWIGASCFLVEWDDAGVPANSTPATATAVEAWQDLLGDPAKLELKGPVERVSGGLQFNDGGYAGQVEGSTKGDGALRLRAAFGGMPPHLRVLRSKEFIAIYAKSQSLVLEGWDSVRRQPKELREFPLREALKPGQEYELELRIVGQTLAAKCNGEVAGMYTDPGWPGHSFAVVVTKWGSSPPANPTLIKAIEYLDLTAKPAASSTTPATATFTNSLGMKFVPVPITGGPTDKQRVLFSIWETRVQDYEVFANETGRAKRRNPVDPLLPIATIAWDDCVAFCEWLTERDRKAGHIGLNEVYRLPTDHEWSCAAGLGQREDAAKLPADKTEKIKDVYPWGGGWPPPAGAGNYTGEENRADFADGKVSWILEGYRDGYASAAPVGRFAPTGLGLFDLGGNVAEFCSDWFDATKSSRVQRGSSFLRAKSSDLLSSYREHHTTRNVSEANGFRAVLAPAVP